MRWFVVVCGLVCGGLWWFVVFSATPMYTYTVAKINIELVQLI